MTPALEDCLDEIARTPVLLVATDFDGTIAPIAPTPDVAEADREALVALRALAQTQATYVAVISGRALADLSRHLGTGREMYVVGSHGSEYEAGVTIPLEMEQNDLLAQLQAELKSIAAATPGALVEEKPASLAFHYRNVDAASAEIARERVASGPGSWPGVHVKHGKKVVELSVVKTDKGFAVERLRRRVGASAVLFLGDDLTDEDAFATLSGPDVGVKVGEGASRARFRATDTLAVASILARVVEKRIEWFEGAGATPIERHSILSDQRTFAVLDDAGRVVWQCLPRVDSAAVFGALLGGPVAGCFEIAAASGELPACQRYLGDSFVLETAWSTFRAVDYLVCDPVRATQRSGRSDLIRVIEGKGRVKIRFAPRLDFGRAQTRIRLAEGGIEIEGVIDPLVLRAPGLPWKIVSEGRHEAAIAEFELGAEPVVLEMRYGTASLEPDLHSEAIRRERTLRYWSSWLGDVRPTRHAPELVRRSALVLKALCYRPTGAILAAPTTSLPEQIGGSRNWDYRFCWPRDAALTAASLVRLGDDGPAIELLDWVLGILDRLEPSSILAPVYTVTGAHLGTEGEIGELGGYCASRPVRVGNSASHQVQLDVFGPIAELLALLARRGAPLSSEHWRLIDSMITAVEARWRDPDHGIWEVRRPRQHHVHSKVMCWVTVDRGIEVARVLGRKKPDWIELRAAIRDDLLERGWNARVGAFCATYEDSEPDASALSIGLSGLLPPGDPRFRSTVEFVERTLREGPTVYRYRYDDGLPGTEGGFNICTTWLIEAYALLGRLDDARSLFADYVAQAGPTGLIAEQYDPRRRAALGNYPQAYSHLGLIDAALRIEEAEAGVAGR